MPSDTVQGWSTLGVWCKVCWDVSVCGQVGAVQESTAVLLLCTEVEFYVPLKHGFVFCLGCSSSACEVKKYWLHVICGCSLLWSRGRADSMVCSENCLLLPSVFMLMISTGNLRDSDHMSALGLAVLKSLELYTEENWRKLACLFV